MKSLSGQRQSLAPISSIPSHSWNVCAKLCTIRDGREETIVLSLDKPVIIGRNPAHCSYVITDTSVSGIHCKVSVVRSPNGGILVSCQDVSKNGIILNGFKIRRASVLLMTGDQIQIPESLSFICTHLVRQPEEKMHVFDPTPPPQGTTKTIGHYVVTSQCLGTGSFATVHLALDTEKQRQVACKSIRVKKEDKLSVFTKELSMLKSLQHPNINRTFGSATTSNFLHIFLELCTGGDLFTYITSYTEKNSRICEAEAKFVVYQLLNALQYLHEKEIAHRDLKPENILLHTPGPYPRILLADFGLARTRSANETFNVCGTVSYLPPEGILALQYKELKYTGMPADCWSTGVILYVMLSGAHPFDYDARVNSSEWFSHIEDSQGIPNSQITQNYMRGEDAVKERIIAGDVDFDRLPWNHMPQGKAKLLVERLLVHNFRDRASVDDALLSRWIMTDYEDLQAAYEHKVLDEYDAR